MDVAKIKSALTATQNELSALYKGAVAAGESDAQALNAIRPLSRARKALDKVRTCVEDAVESVKPKAKKEKAATKGK